MASKGQKLPVQNKNTDAKVVACLAVGGTFVQAAAMIGIEHPAVFYRMNQNAGFKEQVMRARACGIEFRKLMLEDVMLIAAMQIVEDPRYSAMAIFAAKAMLQWSDLSQHVDNGSSIREVLAEVVRRKRIALSHSSKEDVLDFLPATAQVVKT